MLKFNRVTPIGSDSTSGYEVILDKEYTVKSLLDEVLKIEGEWGRFSVRGGSSCDYKRGRLLSKLNDDDLERKVVRVTSSGGWSNMDYRVEVR